MNKKVKKRINVKGFLFLILLFYLLGTFLFMIIKMPVKNIKIEGLVLLKEAEILKIAKINDYPNILKVSKNKIEKELLTLPLVQEVNIKKTLTGKLNIEIKENKVLFLNANTEKLVLENNKLTDYNELYLGVPILINYTPDEIYLNLVKKMSLINQNIINKISEIKYDPNIKEDVVLDDERFILQMNDGNKIYINIVNFNKLAKYDEIYEILEKPGILYLDSASKNYIFEAYN